MENCFCFTKVISLVFLENTIQQAEADMLFAIFFLLRNALLHLKVRISSCNCFHGAYQELIGSTLHADSADLNTHHYFLFQG